MMARILSFTILYLKEILDLLTNMGSHWITLCMKWAEMTMNQQMLAHLLNQVDFSQCSLKIESSYHLLYNCQRCVLKVQDFAVCIYIIM